MWGRDRERYEEKTHKNSVRLGFMTQFLYEKCIFFFGNVLWKESKYGIIKKS